MKEEFDLWNKVKKDINIKDFGPFFKERDIFYLNVGKNIGFEEDGKGDNFLRPVLVFKKFNNFIFLGIPLTSKNKNNKKFYFKFSFSLNIVSYAILSQIRLFDYKRLERKCGVMNIIDFVEIKKTFIEMIQ